MNFASSHAYIPKKSRSAPSAEAEQSPSAPPPPPPSEAAVSPAVSDGVSPSPADSLFSAQLLNENLIDRLADDEEGAEEQAQEMEGSERKDSARDKSAEKRKKSAGPSSGGFFSRLFGSSSSRRSEAAPAAPIGGRQPISEAVVADESPAPEVPEMGLDTNVASIDFSSLSSLDESKCLNDYKAEKRAIYCESCGAALSQLSIKHISAQSMTDSNPSAASNLRYWRCEFGCGHESLLHQPIEESKANDMQIQDYLIQFRPELDKEKEKASDANAAASSADSEGSSSSDSDGSVIFVIDTSGSMSSTIEVPKNVQFARPRRALNRSAFDIPLSNGERSVDFHVPQNFQYVSRLECVQYAIDKQITDWKKDAPQKRVSLVHFSDKVEVWNPSGGNGVLSGKALYEENSIKEFAQRFNGVGERCIGEGSTADKYLDHVYSLQEGGQTALGPALLLGIELAALTKRAGTRIILCTDGRANIGCGALDGLADADAKDAAARWYDRMGELAASHGISVSVLSIIGSEAGLTHLGRVSERTGGSVQRVDPTELGKSVDALLSKPVLGSQVEVKVFIHKSLRFRWEDAADAAGPAEPGVNNRLIKHLGNVTEDTEFTFEYETIPVAGDVQPGAEELTELPFQCQITFTRPSTGRRYTRILSYAQPVTNEREQAEANARVDLLAANSNIQAARLASSGDYARARMVNYNAGRVLQRAAKLSSAPESKMAFKKWMKETRPLEETIRRQQVAMSVNSPMGGFAYGASPVPSMPAMSPPAAVSAAPSPMPQSLSMASPNMSMAQMQRSNRYEQNDSDYEQISKFKVKSSKAYRN